MKRSDTSTTDSIDAIWALTISNDLYGSEKLFAYEMAKGFPKPISTLQQPVPIDNELRAAHDELIENGNSCE